MAKTLHSDGVHLCQDDNNIKRARLRLSHSLIICIFCHNQLKLAFKAPEKRSDYIAFGAFFNSPTKPNAPRASIELLRSVKQKIHIPICTIGGITLDNAAQLIDNGADMVAVISSLFSANDIVGTAQQFDQLFTHPIIVH